MDKDFSADIGSEALPSIATLERYVGGEMATDERERLEAQIAKDPLLADAVEGLRMSLGEADHAARLSRIRSRVTSSVEAMPQTESLGSKRKSRVKPFPQYLVYTAVAAGFALLLVFVGLMRNGENSEEDQNPELITQNTPVETEEVPESSPPETLSQSPPPSLEEPADSSPQPTLARSSAPEREIEPIPQEVDVVDNDGMEDIMDEEGEFSEEVGDDIVSPSPQPQMAPEPTITPTDPSTYESTTGGEVNAIQSRQQEELAKLAETAAREETEVIREPTRPASAAAVPVERARRNQYTPPTVDFNTEDLEYQNEADQTAGAVSKAQLMADLLTEAIRLHDEEKLDSANLLLDEVLLSEKNNVVASYYKGKSLTDQKKYSEAIPFLLTASEVETSAVFEEAQWQLAQAYLGAEKKRKARSLLTTISEGAGKYQAEAAELLQNMD